MQSKKEKNSYLELSCEEMAKELSAYAMVELKQKDIANIEFGTIASMAPIHELAVFKYETKEALKIYSIFQSKCIGAEQIFPHDLNLY